METERIAASQPERGRLKMLRAVQQKHVAQVAAAERLKVIDRLERPAGGAVRAEDFAACART
jgi:hypothetical protein